MYTAWCRVVIHLSNRCLASTACDTSRLPDTFPRPWPWRWSSSTQVLYRNSVSACWLCDIFCCERNLALNCFTFTSPSFSEGRSVFSLLAPKRGSVWPGGSITLPYISDHSQAEVFRGKRPSRTHPSWPGNTAVLPGRSTSRSPSNIVVALADTPRSLLVTTHLLLGTAVERH